MPILTVIAGDELREIPFSTGSSVREILDATDLRVRSGCRGNGACGLCLISIEAGDPGSPKKTERLLLSPEQLAVSTRLACQLIPERSLTIRIQNPAQPSKWHSMLPGSLSYSPSRLGPLGDTVAAGAVYGLAVDLGTTHISLTLWDLIQGRRIADRVGPNPQSAYGMDVITRLIAASESADEAKNISRLALEAVADALRDICSRQGLSQLDVGRATVVGNTPMLALLTETDPNRLLRPQGWTQAIEYRPHDPRSWANILGIHPDANVDVVSPIAGFVGSDLLAGVLATDLTCHPGSLLIDFGTNSEMALWDGRVLWVTSAAGGPAFENSGSWCGMPAETGAIYRVERQMDAAELSLQVIGGGEARGLCGSGLVDLIALLRSRGDLKPIGKLAGAHLDGGYVVDSGNPSIRLTNRDVDGFQRAKAAIGVGIKSLMAAARMNAGELKRVCVCGVFGQQLDIHNAQSVGLLPQVAAEHVESCGNTALAGCERLLLSPSASRDLAGLRERAAIISLSQLSGFDALFMENLYLQPMEVDGP